MPLQRFIADQVYITPEATHAVADARLKDPDLWQDLVERHQRGEWGDIHANQRVVNEVAVEIGKGVVKSVFTVDALGEVWLMTSLCGSRGLPIKTVIMLAGQPLHLTD